MQFEKLVSNLDYNNRVQRSDGVVGTITQVYKNWALWALLEPTATEIYQTITEENANEFRVLVAHTCSDRNCCMGNPE